MEENEKRQTEKTPNAYSLTQMQLKPIAAGIDKIDRSWKQFVALFPYCRLYYVRHGEAHIVLRNKDLHLRSGHIYFIPAFSIIDADCDTVLDHMWFHFQLDVSTENYLSIVKPVYEVAALETDEALFCEMITAFHTPARSYSPMALLRTDGICRYFLSRFLPVKDNANNGINGAKFMPVLQYVNEHLCEPIANKDLAALLYLSTTYFSNLFTKQFGIPPRRYILNQRLSAAAAKLLETQNSVKEIAFSLGFENESYFNRIFRKFAGVPPYTFRRLYTQGK